MNRRMAPRAPRPTISSEKESIVTVDGLSRTVPLVHVRVERTRVVSVTIVETATVAVRAREEAVARDLAIRAVTANHNDLTWLENEPLDVGPNDCDEGGPMLTVLSVATQEVRS